MKFFIKLLTAFVLFLAFKPAIDLVVLSGLDKMSCCVTMGCESSEVEENLPTEKPRNCSGNSCNPFQACGTCFVLLLAEHDLSLERSAVVVERKFSNEKSFTSQYFPDFWQPPKIV